MLGRFMWKIKNRSRIFVYKIGQNLKNDKVRSDLFNSYIKKVCHVFNVSQVSQLFKWDDG